MHFLSKFLVGLAFGMVHGSQDIFSSFQKCPASQNSHGPRKFSMTSFFSAALHPTHLRPTGFSPDGQRHPPSRSKKSPMHTHFTFLTTLALKGHSLQAPSMNPVPSGQMHLVRFAFGNIPSGHRWQPVADRPVLTVSARQTLHLPFLSSKPLPREHDRQPLLPFVQVGLHFFLSATDLDCFGHGRHLL